MRVAGTLVRSYTPHPILFITSKRSARFILGTFPYNNLATANTESYTLYINVPRMFQTPVTNSIG